MDNTIQQIQNPISFDWTDLLCIGALNSSRAPCVKVPVNCRCRFFRLSEPSCISARYYTGNHQRPVGDGEEGGQLGPIQVAAAHVRADKRLSGLLVN